jgi:CubicO group peptidase (beta-lactamase class C family)
MDCRKLVWAALLILYPVVSMAQEKDPLKITLDSLLKSIPDLQSAAFTSITKDTARSYFYGIAENGQPVNEKTLFALKSSSFIFTSLVFSLQVQYGYMNPRFLVEELITGAYRIGDKKGMINLLHLATHTSGLELPSDMFDWSNQNPEWLMDRIVEAKIGRQTEHLFTDFNTAILVYILSKHSRKGFFPQVKQNILNPLGMQHSFEEVPRWYGNRSIDTSQNWPFYYYSTLADLTSLLNIELNPPENKLGKAVQLSQASYKSGTIFDLCLGWQYYPSNNWFLNMSKPGELNCIFAFDSEQKAGFILLINGPRHLKFPSRTYIFDVIRRHLR